MGVNKKLNSEDLKQFVTEDLVAKLAADTASLKKLEFNHAVSTLDNPASIRAKRRDVARMITELNKRKKENKA
ncbi:MAG TPA: 50S ribosomal protein L29 [Chitinophagales bacterium]|nr:50S ribosomal protein L29 [Chitinophagales bacterium]